MHGGQAIDRPDGRPTGLPPVFRGFCVRVREWQWDTTSAGDGQGPSQAPSRGNTDGENEVSFKDKRGGQASQCQRWGVLVQVVSGRQPGLLLSRSASRCVSKRPGAKGLRVARMPRGLGGTRLQRAEKRALAGHTPLANTAALTRSVSAPAHMWVTAVGLNAGISMCCFSLPTRWQQNLVCAGSKLVHLVLFHDPFISTLLSLPFPIGIQISAWFPLCVWTIFFVFCRYAPDETK
ncbi:hypothetical protein VTG60DRAFT_1861 [Thermothelomyces hinnuleus]